MERVDVTVQESVDWIDTQEKDKTSIGLTNKRRRRLELGSLL